MTLVIGDEQVRASAEMARLIDAVEDVLLEEHEGHVIVPPRLNLMSGDRFLRLMPAYLRRSGYLGYKSFHGSMAEGVRYVIVLIREADGEVVALVDAAYLTALRTGATSGVAARHLARGDAAAVGLLGSGLEAETNLAAVAAVRPVSSVRVYSRNSDRRQAFARAWSDKLGIEVRPVDSAKAAVADSDIVIVATNTGMNGPVAYEGAWLEPGQLVISIGATSPFLREVDAETFDRADEVVFDASPEQVLEESGDLLAVGEETKRRLRGARVLPDVVASGSGHRPPGTTTLFKSVGTAAQDIAAARAIYEVVVARGLARDIGEIAEPKRF